MKISDFAVVNFDAEDVSFVPVVVGDNIIIDIHLDCDREFLFWELPPLVVVVDIRKSL